MDFECRTHVAMSHFVALCRTQRSRFVALDAHRMASIRNRHAPADARRLYGLSAAPDYGICATAIQE